MRSSIMIMTWQHLKTWSLTVLLAGSVLTATHAADKPALRADKTQAVEITRIKPSKGDVRNAKKKTGVEAADPAIFAIKVHVTMPPPGAQGYVLYIGDAKIAQYGEFSEGIFF